MLFTIHHSVHYSYERPVVLEPLTLRLTPRQDVTQRLIRQDIHVSDAPDGRSRILEADGVDATVLWFTGHRDRLEITVDTVVETLRDNPFDWILTQPGSERLPMHYPPGEAWSLASCRSGHGVVIPESVAAWAEELAASVNHATTEFLMALADGIHHTFHHIGRLDGEPQTPEETLSRRTGACRDTAMLFVAACRSQGLAARFVSGYSIHHPPEVSEHELHAWAEVYLPGGGWRGYDPSLGLAVADGHVILAAAPDHRLAAPMTGTYRGTQVNSSMSYAVRVSATA
jgi:transglutaminase-like putative cysteine protease